MISAMTRPDPTKTVPGALIGPEADRDFAAIAAPEIRHRVRLAHLVFHLRRFSQTWIGKPVGKLLLQVWLNGLPGAKWIERRGLPRRSLEQLLGPDALIRSLDPQSLVQFAMHPPGTRHKSPSWSFIHDGDWDLCRVDLREDYAIKLVRDLDTHRHDLTQTAKYKELMERVEQGKPWHSHQEGLYLDSPERILAYLRVYLGFLDQMAKQGYDASRAKDYPGIAITREGRIVKVKRGAHRLAMAQWLSLPVMPFRVSYVHRQWWDQVTQGAQGHQALERVRQALAQAEPEQHPGPLTPG